ncbi:MAG: hypothetical protein JWP00_1469 [Chloroflexi bacterium]|jgi:hypothetical protein|nr:hypothetical protein [Chloroflexota bacterium]
MTNENTSSPTPEVDVTVELARLVDAGWDEAQIAQFARRRATYGMSAEDPECAPTKVSSAERLRLEFARWLYQNGRISA